MSRHSPNLTLRKPPYDSDRSAIEQLVNQGFSDSQIAQKYGVSKDTIWCRRARWNLPSGLDARKTNRLTDITELWKQGYTVQEIADCLKLTNQMVYSVMTENNLRELPRLGIDAPNMSLTQLREAIFNEDVDEEDTIVVTHSRLPKWVLVPIEDYKDLLNGVYHELREVK